MHGPFTVAYASRRLDACSPFVNESPYQRFTSLKLLPGTSGVDHCAVPRSDPIGSHPFLAGLWNPIPREAPSAAQLSPDIKSLHLKRI
jgi:hypothetical protein